jgi:hypothetical protein
MTQLKYKVNWGGILRNSKGLSVLFLVIAMMVMVTIGYVFSYLIPTKQKSVSLTVSSNQAFFLAQSGVEFAVRYASDNSLCSLSSPITRNLGNGRFTISYEGLPIDRLTSIGEVLNASQRKIVVSSFSTFIQKKIVLVTGSPCWINTNERVRFDIRNESGSDITIRSFEATWSQTQATRIRDIFMGTIPPPPLTQKFSGNYGIGDGPANLNSSQTIAPSQVIRVDVRWQHNRVLGNINFTFYTVIDGTGECYTINVGTPSSICP